MSNRLRLFRERMAAFEGAADPGRAIESGYYVNEPGKLQAETISNRIALRPASSHLLIGGTGSGKTTQLLIACENLKKIEDIYPIYIDVSLYTDISKIEDGVITAIAGLEISELAQLMLDNEDSSPELDLDARENINIIRKLAYGYSEKVKVEKISSSLWHNASQVEFEKIQHQGIIPEKYNSDILYELINAVRQVVQFAAHKYRHIVLLFDGLDRIYESKTFAKIIDFDANILSELDVGIVIVGPLTSLHQENIFSIENSLDYFYRQPYFDIEKDPDAYNFFKKVLKSRSQEDFIDEAAFDLLIKFSGGVLRDLINLTQASIEETYMSGDMRLEAKHVSTAVASFGKAQILGLDDYEVKILQKIIEKEKFIPRGSTEVNLLLTRRIIEYKYPKNRYAVHPAITPIIEQIYA